MKTLTNTIRILLTAFLLTETWFHAHWSVALSLTLSAIAIELLSIILVNVASDLRKIKKYL